MLNLSLSGCGFLGIYHIGVISAFREHAPEIIEKSKISGCSAGSLVAACAVSDCCLGQMVSDVLEIALKARSHALGPLHPSFSIVDILRNGLRRILPVDAHKLCSGRVHISLTRWKDGKNFLVNQFDTREELIQALICSSFVPCYSGFLPPKFKGTYYWDGGLSNNNPILDQDTILVSPFGGEADICPRDESASYYCMDFQGTNLQWSYENIYRISKALFPPNPQVLKAMCFRGYKDAISFLKSRNLLQCSCYRLRDKTSISSVIGEDLNAYSLFEENNLGEENDSSIYDSEEDNIIQYSQSNLPLNYQEMPPSVCQILDAACDDNKGILNYVYDSQLSRAISIFFLPWTLPFEYSFSFTKKFLELIPKIDVSPNSSGLFDSLFIFVNYMIHKFTYDRYQYHSRVTCKLCISAGKNRNSIQSLSNIQFNVCYHATSSSSNMPKLMSKNSLVNKDKMSSYDENNSETLNGLNASQLFPKLYHPKLCARHRVPSICSSETGGATSLNSAQFKLRKSRRNRSYVSNTSDLASSVDLNEFKLSKSHSYSRRRKYFSESSNPNIQSLNKKAIPLRPKRSNKSLERMNLLDKSEEEINLEDKMKIFINSQDSNAKSQRETSNRVHFHLSNNTDDENDDSRDLNSKVASNESINFISESNNDKMFTSSSNNMLIEPYNDFNIKGPIVTEPPDDNDNEYNPRSNDNIVHLSPISTPISMPNLNASNNSERPMEWDSYFDNLELNALGRVNIDI